MFRANGGDSVLGFGFMAGNISASHSFTDKGLERSDLLPW